MVRSAAAGLALCLGALCASDGHAQSRGQRGDGARSNASGGLSDMLLEPRGRRPTAPAVARYVVEDSVSFVLDRSSPLPLVRFDGSNEVWVLTPKPGSSGDTIYKNDVGETVLRATGLGGLIVFTATRPEGAAAALAGGGSSLKLSPVTNVLLSGGRLAEASGRAGRFAGQEVEFNAPETDDQNLPIILDAANIVVEAFGRLARSEKTRRSLKSVETVFFLEGKQASARFDRGRLTIVVTPRDGFAGRPSSETIMRQIQR